MSAAAVARFVASVSVDRTCACGATFTVRQGERRSLCMPCMEEAAERAAEARRVNAERIARAREKRAAMTCDECGTRLLVPAAICGLCMGPDFDLEAALAALDTNEAAVHAAASATPNGRTPR